jgi:3-keto-5-aminohexanoate cleavage enzyme
MAKVWIEAALNGPWGRERQPGIPVTVEHIIADGIACARAGAAIIHLHAYDVETGRQRDDPTLYARIIEGVRAQVDAIVYPTIPLAGSAYAGAAGDATERYAHVTSLAERGLLEWFVVDPGSVNFARLDAEPRGSDGFIYANPVEHVLEGLQLGARHKLHPSCAIYEPGFLRLGAALLEANAGVPCPIYRFMFSDEFAWGFPARAEYLAAYLSLLRETAADLPWMIAGLGVDIRPLIEAAVRDGGHVRVGLEDAPWGSEMDNRAWVEDAVRRIRSQGGEPASPAEVRADLARADHARPHFATRR